MHKQAVVVHSGGMDSSLCLALAVQEYGAEQVLSVSFRYQQRHSLELERARMICDAWGVDHIELELNCLAQITDNALLNKQQTITHQQGEAPNTLVVGRNGLMARIAAIHAQSLAAHVIYMGVIEVESANSGYRDCSREYMDLMQQILRIDLDDATFEIRTPLVYMTKLQTMELAYELGVLQFLLEQTVTCYEGVPLLGCQHCPACLLRNEGIKQFSVRYPDAFLPYTV